MPAPAKRFDRIALVGRFTGPETAEPLAGLAQRLVARGHAVVVEAETAQRCSLGDVRSVDADVLGEHADVAIVVGGDGTMLSIARKLAPLSVPLIGVNQGRLGFLTDVPLASMEPTLDAMLAGRYVEERRTLLEAVVVRNGSPPERALALNDVAINRGSRGTLIECAVEIDGRFGFAMRADGIIIATPTGSTAYALSAGGPILAPDVPAFALVPVAPHALTHRPLAVADTATIRIGVVRGEDASAHCDGQTRFALGAGESVTVRRAPYAALFLHPEGYDYFATLREKLHWSKTPSA